MSDLISRADAIDAVQDVDTRETVSVSEAVKALMALPSAERVVRCKDCLQKHIGGSVTHYYWCDRWDMEVDDTDYCAWGERREE